MDMLLFALTAIVVGGLAGSAWNVVATRLPAPGDPAIVGLPLRPGTGQPDPLALVPFYGAWQPRLRAIDWPKIGTEISAAVIVAVALIHHGLSFDAFRAAVFALILLLIMRIDWQNHLIFTITILPGYLVALGLQAADSLHRLMVAAAVSVGAGLVFFAFFMLAILIYKSRALGLGDIWLAMLIGAMTAERAGGAILLGMFLAAAGGLFLIAIRVRSRTDYIPYGAYLCLGAMVVVLL